METVFLCATAASGAQDWGKRSKQRGRDGVRAQRLDLMRKSEERRARGLKTGAEGEGTAGAPHKPERRLERRCVMARNAAPLVGERERSWGQRVGL